MIIKNSKLTAGLSAPSRLNNLPAKVEIKKMGHFYKINWHSDPPTCTCGAPAKPQYENNGWDGEEGPRKDEITNFICPIHGKLL